MGTRIELADLIPSPVVVLDRGGRVLGTNAIARRTFDLRRDDPWKGRALADVVGDAAARVEGFLERAWGSSSWTPGALTVERGNGRSVRCRAAGARVAPTPDAEPVLFLRLEPGEEDESTGRFLALNGKLEELSAEVARRRRVEALLAGEKAILEAVAAGAPLSEALEQLAHLVEAQSRGMLASILVLDDRGRLRNAASPSLPRAYCEAIEGVEIGPSVGSCGTAAFRGERVVVPDIGTDPLWADYRELALTNGLRACWSTPIRDDRREVLGTLAFYYDTPRSPTDAEISLADTAAHVAGLAIARHAAQLERARLLDETRRALARAQAANAAKDRFLAMLGHELRNPLGAILTAARAAESLAQESRESAHLNAIIVRQGHNLSRILDDLLDVARIDAGKLTLKPEVVDVAELCEQCVEIAAPTAEGRSLKLEARGAPAFVHGDPTRLEQVIRNLLDNAIKYTPDGGRIEVAVLREGGHVVVRVQDDGEGVDPAYLERVFEPFSQAPQALARSAGGIGLGLPLVKRLVELHAGSVALASAGPGLGTQVEVRIPAHDAPSAAPSPPVAEPAGAPEGRSVLVVEDNDDARFALCTLLSRWGHTITDASDGRRGLELALGAGCDVALIDIGLPLLDGYELARAIRSSETARPIKLVAMTGYGQPEDRRRALEAGFDDHLVKPVTDAALREAIESLDAPRPG